MPTTFQVLVEVSDPTVLEYSDCWKPLVRGVILERGYPLPELMAEIRQGVVVQFIHPGDVEHDDLERIQTELGDECSRVLRVVIETQARDALATVRALEKESRTINKVAKEIKEHATTAASGAKSTVEVGAAAATIVQLALQLGVSVDKIGALLSHLQ